jgi:MFS transporter, FHS family, glucose/mannose:H+ symporter
MPAIVLMAYASLFALGLLDNVRGPLFPDIVAEMGVSPAKGSWFFAWASLLAVLGGWCGYLLAQRWGARACLIVGSALLALAAAMMAWAASLLWLYTGAMLLGAGMGVLNVGQNLSVTRHAPPHLRRRWFSALHAMYGLAAMMAPVMVSLLRDEGWGWRNSLLVFATLPVLVVVGLLWQGRPSGPPVESATLGVGRLQGREWLHCAVLAAAAVGYLWGEISVTTRLVLWLREDLQWSPETANLYLTGFSGLLLAGRLVLSVTPFHSVSTRTWLVGSGGFAGVFVWMGLYVHPVAFLAAGLAMSPFYPMVMDQVQRQFPHASTSALSLVIVVGNLAVMVMHMSIGAMSAVWSLKVALAVCGTLPILSAVLLLLWPAPRVHPARPE